MNLNEYKANVKKVHQTRKHIIKNSVGINDFINAYTKSNNIFTELLIRLIIKRINLLCAYKIAEGHYLKLPSQIGGIELRHYDTYVKLVNGKIKTNRPIDWNATMDWWYSDEEAKRQKKLLRVDNKKVFKIYYNKGAAKYNNKLFITFVPNRFLKTLIKNNIHEGIIKDTFKYNGKYN